MHMNVNGIPRQRRLAAVSLAACLAAAYPAAAADGTAAAAGTALVNCSPPGVKAPPCYSPQAYQVAYGVAPLLSRGIDGRGETVVVGPEPAAAPPSTDIRQDLDAFDTTFGLPPASLNVVNIARSATPYLCGDEEITDTEMVHAIAPDATLDAVLEPADLISSPAKSAAAVTSVIREGVALHAAVISISLSIGEHFLTSAEAAQMNAALEQAREQHITVVDGSGDTGALSRYGPPVEVGMPASDPLVLGVGGTVLDVSPAGAYLGEMAWNDNTEASGGGYSGLFPRPSYQGGLARARATRGAGLAWASGRGAGLAWASGRGVPDVAANADPSTAMALEYDDGELRPNQGTSASGPLWAGVITLADQEAGHPLGFVNPAIYAIARGPAYHRAFHDVITGDNSVLWPTGVFTGYTAGPGWDPVTGWGSPDAQYLVPLLAQAAGPGALQSLKIQDPQRAGGAIEPARACHWRHRLGHRLARPGSSAFTSV
ncbi:MAG: S53 family peptidase [Streptosporangiaceae bacterium]|nr:S53 family peptidase [Streptosporangiaceae bacterium]